LGAKTYIYDFTSTSQIHAIYANGEESGRKDIHDTVTSSVNGGVEAPFQVVKTTHPV
jgi:hypothetical protein